MLYRHLDTFSLDIYYYVPLKRMQITIPLIVS